MPKLRPAMPGAGRPPFAITKAVLKKLEKAAQSGVAQKWAAMALGISQETFTLRLQDNPDFLDAWRRGREKFSEMVMEAAPKIMRGLILNGTTPTENAPGGHVGAQLGFLEKVVRRPDAEENQGHVNLEEIGGIAQAPEEGGITEIQEVRVRRIRRIPSGRIEDDE